MKKIEGLEAVAGTLQELWLSYNSIEKLNGFSPFNARYPVSNSGIECCKKLKVLYICNNKIKDWSGMMPAVLTRLTQAGLTLLEDVLFSGNPIEEKCSGDGNWVQEITKRFPFAKKLDGKILIREEPDEDKAAAE